MDEGAENEAFASMRRKHVAIAINNEEYLRAHPELRSLVHGFVCALVESKPADVGAFASAWFTRPALAASLGLHGWERPEDEAELAALAVERGSGPTALLAGTAARAVDSAAVPASSAAGEVVDALGATGAAGAPGATLGANVQVLEKQLVSLFTKADKDGNGVLDQREFKALISTSALGLRAVELRRLLAEIDEDDDGNVSYAEFVPVAIDVLQAMRAREAVSAAERELDAAADRAAGELVNGIPRAEMLALAQQAFEAYDSDGSGLLSRHELKRVLRDTRLALSARQVRLVLARLDTSGDEQLSIDEFAPLVVEILVAQFKSELRAASWGGVEAQLRALIARADAEGTGVLHRSRLVDVLLLQDTITLSRMQANAMVAAAREEEDGSIALDEFVPVALAMLRALSAPGAVAERARMLERADFAPIELMGGREREAMEANFAEAFARFDVDNNQLLDESEFELCLGSAALGLERHEMYALMGLVDRNEDGLIDAREFVACAYSHLLQIRREQRILAAQRERAW
ncbi:hypothetical protein KFE25_001389 [Diacronema lutheri]|uniref:EF-hand domain-containing protein n=1 Tax=Diacronema lutheri TaxID=2081491 RepID=A0A8J5X5X1_DIALT|nr:hypothetical protein KFE25_001389 [Diacronema lutheri]